MARRNPTSRPSVRWSTETYRPRGEPLGLRCGLHKVKREVLSTESRLFDRCTSSRTPISKCGARLSPPRSLWLRGSKTPIDFSRALGEISFSLCTFCFAVLDRRWGVTSAVPRSTTSAASAVLTRVSSFLKQKNFFFVSIFHMHPSLASEFFNTSEQ